MLRTYTQKAIVLYEQSLFVELPIELSLRIVEYVLLLDE